MKKPIRLKLISMGNAEVGKSCIIKRFCEKRFVAKYLATIGIDYGVTKVTINDRELKINIFDMAGHPLFYEVRNEFYRDTQGALLVYDVSNRESFEGLESWRNELNSELGREASGVIFVLCGNKIDKRRSVGETEARLWAESRGFHYYETSALTGEGIHDMFQMVFANMLFAFENGGVVPTVSATLGYTREQADVIQRLRNSKDNYERLGLMPGASRDEINRAYKRLAVLIHPDKNEAPGSEEAFKILTTARSMLLQRLGITA